MYNIYRIRKHVKIKKKEACQVPKIAYKLVYDDLMRLICGKYIRENEMLPPENTLAVRYNVSRPTIRKVLQMLSENDLIQSKAGIGWQVCSAGSRRKKERKEKKLTIGVDTAPGVWGYFYYDLIMNGIRKAAEEREYRLIVTKHYDQEPFREEEIDGLILSKTSEKVYRQCADLPEKGIPAVFINRRPENQLFSYCTVDYVQEARKAVEHLLLLGHRNIAIIRHTTENSAKSDMDAENLRCCGWSQAFTANGIPPPEDLILPFKSIADLTEALKRARPSAVFIPLGASIIPFLLAVERAGLRIPDDISAICFDDISSNQLVDIPISHIRMPLEIMGQRAVQYIANHAANPNLPPLHLTMEADLVINSSCKNINREKIRSTL